jgi:hypothetical protein
MLFHVKQAEKPHRTVSRETALAKLGIRQPNSYIVQVGAYV